jgi:L-rhamnose mutarotase
MNRLAFKMKLFPGYAHEYKKRHDQLWPELSEALKSAGVKEYSIFLDEETNYLFSTLRVDDLEGFGKLPALEIMEKWWKHMADIMETNADYSPVAKQLKEVFYLP